MQSNLYILGLVGYKHSGKDTVCAMMRRQFSALQCERIAFADALKDEVCKKLGCTREFLEANKSEFREYLQKHGQEAKETRGRDVWLNKVADRVLNFNRTKTTIFFITDVRFPFEAEWVRNVGGLLIKIDRFEMSTDPHPSEQAVNEIRSPDFRVTNKGSLRDLEREVKWTSEFVKERWKMI